MSHDSYSQSTGKLFQVADDGTSKLLGVGFAGNDSRPGANPSHIPGRNNPEAQTLRCIGPLPVGWYTMGEPFHHPELGPLTFILTPDPTNEMFGRDSFRMHGASATDPLNSSEGCIVQAHDVRQAVADSGVRRLQVTA